MKNKKIILFAFFLFVMAVLFSLSLLAAPGTGYCIDDKGATTNIKWTMDQDGTLKFEIDPLATDKVQTTLLYRKDPVTGVLNGWDKAMPTYEGAVKIIIGDGITHITGFSALSTLKEVELAPSVTEIGDVTFESDSALSSVYIRGKEKIEGVFDFSNITKIGAFALDECRKCIKIILNDELNGYLETECFKATRISEIEITSGVTLIKNGSLSLTDKLEVVTVLGTETAFESNDVFKKNSSFPKIKAKSDSKAAEFAKTNGYTFIDIDTGEETKGTKPTTGVKNDTTVTEEGSGPSTPAVTPPSNDIPDEFKFNPVGATDYGMLNESYDGSRIVNTYWAYYEETNTLKLTSNTTAYNESGSQEACEKGEKAWSRYSSQIKYIEVGPYISKLSGKAFYGMVKVEEIKLGKNVEQLDYWTFVGCTGLKTLWKEGGERIEGTGDFSFLSKIVRPEADFADVAFDTIIFGSEIKSLDGVVFNKALKTIISPNVDALDEYCKANYIDLINAKDPSDVRNYAIRFTDEHIMCGDYAAFLFDESTGTLTVEGAFAISDIVNYYGGGSKTQPWFSIKKQIKHIVIKEGITSIGKYAFTECENLETVQIPSTEGFAILNGAFEKCHNLRSVYIAGDKPIEGTLDLRNVHELPAWTFSGDYLIANVIVSPNVTKIGNSVFDSNTNLANIYGVPGSYAEKYASENDYCFYDIASTVPEAIICTLPETTGMSINEETDKNIAVVTTGENSADENTGFGNLIVSNGTDGSETDNSLIINNGTNEALNEKDNGVLWLPIVIVVVIAVAAVLVIVIVLSKRKINNSEFSK